MDVRVGLWRRLSTKELMLLNCGVGEDSWESLELQEIQPVHSEGDQPWDFFGSNDAEAEAPVLWPPHEKSWLIGKDSDAGRDLRAVGEGDDRGWDGWMASLTRWTWVWVNFRSWWWTGRPGVLRFMGSQRVKHDWSTELDWCKIIAHYHSVYFSNKTVSQKYALIYFPSFPHRSEDWRKYFLTKCWFSWVISRNKPPRNGKKHIQVKGLEIIRPWI